MLAARTQIMPAPSLPQVRANLDTLVHAALATGGETNRFDFKEVLDLRKDEHRVRLVRAIGSFGNTDGGGFILIGVSDGREVVGLDSTVADRYDQTSVYQCVAQYLAPPPSLQVRHHERDGKHLVIVEVDSFVDVPSIVTKSATFGREKLVAGTILFRNGAAQSAVVTSESDMRLLCDAIARRRASTIAELLGGAVFARETFSGPAFEGVRALRDRAEHEWPSGHSATPFVEVAFCPERQLELSQSDLRRVLDEAPVRIEHGFPFVTVNGCEIRRATSWGWYGRIPFAELGSSDPPPSYLWMLSQDGSFLDRDCLWEDASNSVVRGAVGLFHLVGRTILVLRFLDSFSRQLRLPAEHRFRVSVGVSGIRGRLLVDETGTGRRPGARGAGDDQVEASTNVSLAQLQTTALAISTNLVEDVAEQFGREDLRRHQIELAIKRARGFLGSQYVLPGGG